MSGCEFKLGAKRASVSATARKLKKCARGLRE